MDLIAFALIGLGVSGLARRLVGKKSSGWWVASVIAGLLGAFLGGFFGRAVGFHGEETQLAGFILSVVGAILLVAGYCALARIRASA